MQRVIDGDTFVSGRNRDGSGSSVRLYGVDTPEQEEPCKEYLRERLAEGLEDCVVLLRELRGRGYCGGYSILKEYVQICRLGLVTWVMDRPPPYWSPKSRVMSSRVGQYSIWAMDFIALWEFR